MLRQRQEFQVVKSENVYVLRLPDVAPHGEIYDVLNQMKEFTLSLIKKQEEAQAKANEAAKEKIEEPILDPKQEPEVVTV